MDTGTGTATTAVTDIIENYTFDPSPALSRTPLSRWERGEGPLIRIATMSRSWEKLNRFLAVCGAPAHHEKSRSSMMATVRVVT